MYTFDEILSGSKKIHQDKGYEKERGVGSVERKYSMRVTNKSNPKLVRKPLVILLSLLFILVFGSLNAQGAATYYVRADATGVNTGVDWINAYTSLPASLQRGAIYYVADGRYGGYIFNDANSGTAKITIKKATTSDHGSGAYWSSSYGDGQAVFRGSLVFTTSYWILDGVTGGGPGHWTSGYGFYIDRTGTSDGTGIDISDDADNITIKHVEIEGHGDDGSSYSQDGVNSNDGNGPRTFSYIYIHNVGRSPFFNRCHNTTWEFLFTGKFESVSAQHSEISSQWINLSKGVTPINNTIVRWSIFTWAEGTGGLIGEWDGADIYGNIFVKLNSSEFSSSGNGLVGGWSSRIWKNVRIYNNSFINCGVQAIVVPSIGVAGGGIGNIAKNNLFYNTSIQYGSPSVTTYDYNEYINSTPNTYGPNDTTEGTQPYPHYLSLDFTMNRGTKGGAKLSGSGTLDRDMFGNKRGSDGTWDRGAIEYVSGSGGSSAPSTPSGLRIIEP